MSWVTDRPLDTILIAVILLLMLFIFRNHVRTFLGQLRDMSGSGMFPPQLNALIVERLAEAKRQLDIAKSNFNNAATTLKSTQDAAEKNPNDVNLKRQQDAANRALGEARARVSFEEFQIAGLLHPRGLLDGVTWGIVLQYAIFAALALYVLIHLMSGITSSPPPGTTPRSMITLLISVVTVGIALILVLSTIVSNTDDRKERFAQGKEVLTALLGVLGTIVGFYFGTATEQANGFNFDPVVIQMAGDKPNTLTTSVHGGKPPYSYQVTFTPNNVSPVSDITADGRISVPLKVATPVKQETDIGAAIDVTDSDGKKGHVDYKQAIHFKATSELKPSSE
ncbi:MAG TPA: hypothetical protein VG055_32640 [Planctomycetaceae bacterium]|jgi:hypothetical protein|nr:hypothetical protein [Planctomycetaceae bacterium]